MSEYIDRESIRKVLMDVCSDENCPMFIAATIDQVIDYEPAADVAPVVHGEWLNIDGDYTFAACSICETAYEVATEEEAEKGLWDAFMCSYRYCPSCGAKMDGGVTNGEDN